MYGFLDTGKPNQEIDHGDPSHSRISTLIKVAMPIVLGYLNITQTDTTSLEHLITFLYSPSIRATTLR
jgi:hypothetical protein